MVRRRSNNGTSGQAFIPLPQGGTSVLELVNKHTQTLARQEKLLNWTFGFIIAILAVCVIAFITFILDAWRFHYEAYRGYTKTIENLNNKNVQIKEAQINKEIQSLKNQINGKANQSTPISGQ